VKLLRVLQEGRFERLGSTVTRTVNARVIAATNRDLDGMVREAAFRSDLYYRLNVFPIRIPPVRERPGDNPLLVWHFVRLFAEKMGKTIDSVPRRTMESLQAWPGNIRELRNVIENAVIMSDGRTLAPVHLSSPDGDGTSAGTLEEVERAYILKTLGRAGWRIRGEGGPPACSVSSRRRCTPA
jgi:formate hydrogenlyase transcriptional activator